MQFLKLFAHDRHKQSPGFRGLAILSNLALMAGFSLGNASLASAQAAYGSYIGIGPAVGLTSGGQDEPSRTSGVLAVRYKFLEAPISLRAQAIIGDNTAIVPVVSYDIPINWRTDVYIGAGASLVNGKTTTPLGNETSFVLQPGIDYVLPNSELVLFSNAIIAFDAYRNVSNRTAISVQAGIGLKF
jgi:hypothetical protein